MEHVLWIGGGSGAGKTTIALELAHRLDLSADEYGRALEDPSRALIAPSHLHETLEVPS